MGIHNQWPREWREEGGEFIVENVKCKTIFIDAQILLMKSHVKETDTTWREFVMRNFSQTVSRYHTKADTVILSFDNYDSVPIFKSIEQNRRISTNKTSFNFKKGENLPNRPPEQQIWVQALQNRTFKSNIISLIATLMTSEYNPPRKGTTMIIDFVNCVRIDYKTQGQERSVMPTMNAMGESDVKFMRYIEIFRDIIVDSIDSDVLLIALLYKTKHPNSGNIYIKRYKINLKSDEEKHSSDKKRKLIEPKPSKEYEIINIEILKNMLHSCMKQVIGIGQIQCEQHFTHILVFMVLLCGCDYSRKLPRVGVRSVWDNMHIIVPALLQCTQYDTNLSHFSVDVDLCINTLMVDIYSHVYNKHVKQTDPCIQMVLQDLQNSKLSDKIKNEMPTYFSLDSTIRNIQWVVNYWGLENGDPPCDSGGSDGFALHNNRVVFADSIL